MIRTLHGFASLLLLAGCPYLGDQGYTDRVRDVDGDGFVAERFGGPDCRDDDPSIGNCDADGDGFRALAVGGVDCDDTDATVSPDGVEVCNDRDDDCDGLVDNDDDDVAAEAPLRYRDADGDGHGDPDDTLAWCGDTPVGYVLTSDDCNDLDSSIAPSATEICDEIDHNCDGDPYANALQPPTWLSDLDGDSVGDPDDVLAVQCQAPDATAVRADVGSDCDPDDPTISPLASEVPYDGIDQDCDGADLIDQDGDSFAGGPGGTDCDDSRASAYPGAQEVCNGLDDDCDGSSDNGLQADGVTPVLSTFWPDLDSDLRGDELAEPVLACVQPANHVPLAGDCDDDDPTVYTGAPEFCNDVDDDCDTLIDNSPVDGVRRYRDADSDLFGDPLFSEFACLDDLDPAFNWVENDRDCDDSSAQAQPGGTETCDGLDNDCNGAIDDGVGDIRYVDADGDGWGNDDQPVLSCSNQGGDLTLLPGDCNDADFDTNPGAEDICGDAFRQDCRTDISPFDCDADGFESLAAGGTDCDDAEPTVNPAATEVCDAFDNDCDGFFNLDDPSLDLSTIADWYQDLDGDDFGTNVLVAASACDPVFGASPVQGDCDDSDDTVNPDALELCDGVDNDCDTQIDDVALEDRTEWYLDGDGDGDGDKFSAAVFQQCEDPGAGYSSSNGDCRDDLDLVSSTTAETCDGLDNDCDGFRDDDDDDVVATPWYVDDDLDGYGLTASVTYSCEQPIGAVDLPGDCDDTKAAKNPGALEICDALDNDCDGLVDDNDVDVTGNVSWVRDDDGDTYGAETAPDGDRLLRCSQPIGYVLEVPGREDCDDTSATVNPGAFEVCDDRDNDCNGLKDDEDSTLAFAPSWYPDADGDGWGDNDPAATVLTACTQPDGHVQFSGDCNDANVGQNPLAVEVCDTVEIDNDCDGLTALTGDADAVIPTYYLDADGDGTGDLYTTAETTCGDPSFGLTNAVQIGGDCDDTDGAVFPGAPERCNAEDDDCDGELNEDPIDGVLHFADIDDDSYGDPLGDTVVACPSVGVAGYVANADDCNDADDLIFLGAPERCNTIDDDCDGDADEEPTTEGLTYLWDGDQDGHGDQNISMLACATNPPTPVNLWVEEGLLPFDCDPANGTVYPDAPDTCDSVDNDCDGDIDEDGSPVAWFVDGDGDGYGVPTPTPLISCFVQPGYATRAGDCDDAAPTANDGMAVELCDGIDNDCDGRLDDDDVDTPLVGTAPYYLDVDEDGYGVDFGIVYACARPESFANQPGDCDDGRNDVNPGAQELCNAELDQEPIDEDCDGFADNLDSGGIANEVTLAMDNDGDGLGDTSFVFAGCEEPNAGLVLAAAGNDCDDNDPSALELQDWYDDADGDGWAPEFPVVFGLSCQQPQPNTANRVGDCDDGDPEVRPFAEYLVGPGQDYPTVESVRDVACVSATAQLASNYVPPAAAVNFGMPPYLSPTHLTIVGQNDNSPMPRVRLDDSLWSVTLIDGTITADSGEDAAFLTQFAGTLELLKITMEGTGSGIVAGGGAVLANGLKCFDLGGDGDPACLDATETYLDIVDFRAEDIVGMPPVLRIFDAVPGSRLEQVEVLKAQALNGPAIELENNTDLVMRDVAIESSSGGVLVRGPNSNVTIQRGRFYDLDVDEAVIDLDTTGSSLTTIESTLIYEPVAGAGIRDISGLSVLDAHWLTITGTSTALDLVTPETSSLDHAVFWNNNDDLGTAPVANPAWFSNRFEHGGSALACGGPDCLDGVKPDFLAYAPDVNDELVLPIATIGGNLWNADPTQTDANGSWADLGFAGGPNAWHEFLYGTQDDVMLDLWEEHFFETGPGFDPASIDPNGDEDGDGLTNLQEYLLGTHPGDDDTDGDGENDGQELLDGCDPLDPTSDFGATGSCP